MMNGIHAGMSFELAKIASHEQMVRINRAMLIAEARRGSEQQFGISRSIRAHFGRIIIDLGRRISGERLECPEPLPSPSTLRMAR